MAYTTQQLVDLYTNANLGKGPSDSQKLAIDAYASGTTTGAYSDPQALANTLKLVGNTTAVAVETYQFFTGRAPSAAGLSYLVNSTTNANDLNDAYYSKFSAENRFINFSINLATGAGEGAAAFATSYGSVTYAQTVATAYDKIIGNTVAAAAGIDVAASVAFFSRAENITYLTNFVKANTGLTAAADIDLAVKAALIGEILNAAFDSGLGGYAGSTKALIADLSDGSLSTDTAAGVNILTAYPSAGAVGTTYTLTTGADTPVGGNANDTFNALTIKADGTPATTFSAFDSIDGGAGVDTLNIYTDVANNFNDVLPGNLVVKNVEIVNIKNASGAAALADVSKYQGVQELWQEVSATTVTNLATGVTAGFRDILAATTLAADTNATATSAKIALSNVAEGSVVDVDGSASDALTSVTLSGTVADTNGNGAVAATTLVFAVGEDVTTATVNSGVTTTLVIDDTVSTAKVSTVDLSGSTGAITFVGDADVKTITGGAGKDTLTIATATVKDNAATVADETVSALVNTGAGNDTVNVNVTGDGLVTVNTGLGNDTVNIVGRGTAILHVDLGDGSDTFTSAVAINATDVIDAGAGVDTLSLALVGSANVGAFKNFDVFDVKGMINNLDLDILNTNNTVTELVGSGAATNSVTLSNIGAGVNFRATGDMDVVTTVSLTQKTAGALTVTLDADETGTADLGADFASMKVAATNATSVNAVFDTAYLASIVGETTVGDNVSTINLTTAAATAVTVVSGGARAHNVLALTDATSGTGAGKLAALTITGDRDLTISSYTVSTATNQLATVDASASTGGLTAGLSILKDGGVLKLGTGVDLITATATSNATGAEAIQGFEKTLAVSVSVVAGDALAKAAAIADADKIVIDVGGGTNEAVANANVAATGATLANGVLTFTGAGPGTLAAAVAIADGFAETKGETVLFQYLGDSYIFSQGVTHDNGATLAAGVTAGDLLVKLTGTTSVTNLVETGTDTFFIV